MYKHTPHWLSCNSLLNFESAELLCELAYHHLPLDLLGTLCSNQTDTWKSSRLRTSFSVFGILQSFLAGLLISIQFVHAYLSLDLAKVPLCCRRSGSFFEF